MTERLYHEIMCPTLTKSGECNCAPVIVADAPAKSAGIAQPQEEGLGDVVDTETGIRYRVVGRRMIDGDEWVDLALIDVRHIARSVRDGLFNRIFVNATPEPAPSSDLAAILQELLVRWRDTRAHTYSSENADLYRAYDHGVKRCADELEVALEVLGTRRAQTEEQETAKGARA